MSFSENVKNDLVKITNESKIEDLLEIEAMIRFGGEISLFPLKLSFSCNSINVVTMFVGLCKKYYNVNFEVESRIIERFDKKELYTTEIYSVDSLIEDLNLIGEASSYRNSLTDEKFKVAYLRGAFLAKGSVNDPIGKNYHLEISSTNEVEVLFIQKLMNEFELNARIIKRKNYIVCYIKSTEAIGDFLYRIGATTSMNYFQNKIIEKEIKASISRSINLDVANQTKTNDAAMKQMKYIEYLEFNYPLGELDPKLLMVMKVRKENQEASLTQLLDIIHDNYDPNLTKSGLNHRLRKLKEIAVEYKQEREKK